MSVAIEAAAPTIVEDLPASASESQSLQSAQQEPLGDPENAPFSCNVCRRSYTRVDHLARHYRSRLSLHARFATIDLGYISVKDSNTLRRHPGATICLPDMWETLQPSVGRPHISVFVGDPMADHTLLQRLAETSYSGP